MTDKPKLKRTIAKEILFLFAAFGIIGLLWGFLFLRNSYYDYKTKSCSDKIISLQAQLDTLPKDYIRDFYDLSNKYFVVNYKIGDDIYAIPKEQEKIFLTDKYVIQKKVDPVSIYPKGYSYFKISRVTVKSGVTIYFSTKGDLGKQLKKLYSEYADIDDIKLANKVLEKFTQRTDSTIVFDFVSIDKFRDFVSSEDYQEKLYKVFANKTDKGDWIPPEVLRAKFDPMKPYNGIFELGTLSEFKSKVNEALQYDQTVIEEKNKIENKIQSQQELITSSKNSLLTSNEIYSFLVNTLITIGLLLYPVRLSILLFLWALKTVKQKQ
jgi:hypothetical protein